MEIDLVKEQESLSPLQVQQRSRITLPVNDDHPLISTPTFLPTMVSHLAPETRHDWRIWFTGRTIVDRLITIILVCPLIAQQALQLALAHIYHLCDPSLILSVISTYEGITLSQAWVSAGHLPVEDVVQVDVPWLEEVTKQNMAERTKLEVELKTYTNNMIKESIQVSLLQFCLYSWPT